LLDQIAGENQMQHVITDASFDKVEKMFPSPDLRAGLLVRYQRMLAWSTQSSTLSGEQCGILCHLIGIKPEELDISNAVELDGTRTRAVRILESPTSTISSLPPLLYKELHQNFKDLFDIRSLPPRNRGLRRAAGSQGVVSVTRGTVVIND